MRFTVYYTVIVTIAIFSVAFPLALVRREAAADSSRFYRTAFFLPVVVGFGSASLLWAWLMNVDVGLFSPLAYRLGLTEKPVNLLASFDTTFWSIIVMVVWKTAGFNMIILLTGLQGISTEVQEAARMDGASSLAALPPHHPAADAPHDRAGADPVGCRVHAGLRPVLHHRRRRAAEQHGHGGLLDLQPVLRLLPPRLRRGAVDGAAR